MLILKILFSWRFTDYLQIHFITFWSYELLFEVTQWFPTGVAQCVPTWKIASSCMICTIFIVVINSLYVLTLFSVLTVRVFGSFSRFGGFGGWMVGWRWLTVLAVFTVFSYGKRKRWQRCWYRSCHMSCYVVKIMWLHCFKQPTIHRTQRITPLLVWWY